MKLQLRKRNYSFNANFQAHSTWLNLNLLKSWLKWFHWPEKPTIISILYIYLLFIFVSPCDGQSLLKRDRLLCALEQVYFIFNLLFFFFFVYQLLFCEFESDFASASHIRLLFFNCHSMICYPKILIIKNLYYHTQF